MSRNHARLHAGRWRRARQKVFDRDNWRCTICGVSGPLEAHHDPPLTGGADPYDLSGLVTLCRGCHIKLHRTETDIPGQAEWRSFVDELIK